jgi:6-phosphogluconolactonase
MAKFSNIIRKNNENILINEFIKVFKYYLKKSERKGKRFSFVLTGGESPIKLYKKISKDKNVNWRNIDFFIGDERYVNERSKYSNIKMCKKHLLNKIKISKKQIFKISTNSKSIRKDSNHYETIIKNYFKNKKIIFDLILLGIGNDGHIASLFNKNIRVKNNKNVSFIKKKDFNRITLTISSINKSKLIFLWAPGKAKHKIIKKIRLDKTKKYPASFLRKKNNFLFYSN